MKTPELLPRVAATAARNWLTATADFVFPLACGACRRDLPDSDRRLCSACEAALIPVVPNRCQRCSAPVGPHLDTSQGCIHCRTAKWMIGRVFALGAYDSTLREACLRIKRPGGDPLSAALADALLRAWRAELHAAGYDFVMAVPHHWRQRLTRAHLAPRTLASRLAAGLNLRCETGLVRKVRITPLQSTLTYAQRRENLRGAFAPVRGVSLAGGRVLLVDDVLTTGATADGVARTLRALGAEQVDVAVLARGLGR